MSAPLIWIGLPAVAGVVLFLLRNFRKTVNILGVLVSLWLGMTALLLPIGEVITFGSRVIKINERYSILGRDFILQNTDRALLILLFLFLAIWVIGALFARTNIAFIPFGFMFTALLVASLAVEPFLYAALLFEVGVLLAVPFLSPPGQAPGSGVFRFLAFQSLGMPFILLAGWFLAGLEASPGSSALVLRAGVLIGIGLAFLLSIAPFHTWIPTLAEESEPYIAAFVLFMLPAAVMIFGLGFLDRFVWLRDSEAVYSGLRLVGALMVVVGGGWLAVEKNMGRMLGYAAIAETGFSLLAVGAATREGFLLFFWLLAVRVVSYVPWAAAVSRLKAYHRGVLDLKKLWGRGHETPLAAGMAVVGQFSLLGMPLLAGFSARFALWRALSGISFGIALAALIGSLGLLVGALRSLNALFIPFAPEEGEVAELDTPSRDRNLVSSENLLAWVMYGLLIAGLGVIGYFPQLYLPWIERLLFIFERLGA